jgi:uncharacterized protein
MTLVGISFLPELEALLDLAECIELIGERYIGPAGTRRAWELDTVSAVPSIQVHGLNGNLASVTGPEPGYLDRMRRLADRVDARLFSDHLALTCVGGHALGHLAPNLFDAPLLTCCVAHVERTAHMLGRPVLVENLATTVQLPGSAWTPEEFFLRLLDATDACDALLDLTNVWTNSQNFGFDPSDVVCAVPHDRIRSIHLAGGSLVGQTWIDSHSWPVHDEVFGLLDQVLTRCRPQTIIIERDARFATAVSDVTADVARVRAMLREREGAVVVGANPPL